MDFNFPPVGGIDRVAQPQRAGGTKPGARVEPSAAVTVDTLPASPPDDVLEQMSAASRVVEALHEQGRELHFEQLGEGRVQVQVRDLDGNVIRTIPASKALDVAAGQPLD
jgi:flagellar protein FlaG